MSSCFCIGKLKGCTCDGRCACACTCASKYKSFDEKTFEYNESLKNIKESKLPPNCS
jgi:hypothetical protein